ncbi:3-oxo-5-alpha-steroid 4-dehydrogenase [Artemisia annua]|uniref:3-oxo-5-alpha-steroid 4-dehydrogenase n=1 Tax=Artemisia annua TaxID=35608 RepID=A0A2U1NDL2_ARTAN|nr:3-oxo-5-alpha-steroid 4-dehydrogenase [Artemisia annua]
MAISFLPMVLFPLPPSLFVTVMSIISCLSLANGGYMETKGKHMQYSKFFSVADSKKSKDQEIKLSSRSGMLLLYTPAFLVGHVSFAIFHNRDLRFIMVISVLTIHFFKRVLEVLLVHKYSGSMALDAAISISLSYTISTATMIYAQYLSQSFDEPAMDLKYIGTTLFLIGITGNFYHHYILSNLRKKGDSGYRIPKGGLFNLVICPHYLFEIIQFVGVACICQTVYSFSFTLGTAFYLMGRSYATREWYILKFGDKFHKDVKALVPYIF